MIDITRGARRQYVHPLVLHFMVEDCHLPMVLVNVMETYYGLHLLHEACRTLTRVHLPKSRVNPKIYDHIISDDDNKILFCVPPKAGCSAFKILSPSCATFYLDRGGGGLRTVTTVRAMSAGLVPWRHTMGPVGRLGMAGASLA